MRVIEGELNQYITKLFDAGETQLSGIEMHLCVTFLLFLSTVTVDQIDDQQFRQQ